MPGLTLASIMKVQEQSEHFEALRSLGAPLLWWKCAEHLASGRDSCATWRAWSTLDPVVRGLPLRLGDSGAASGASRLRGAEVRPTQPLSWALVFVLAERRPRAAVCGSLNLLFPRVCLALSPQVVVSSQLGPQGRCKCRTLFPVFSPFQSLRWSPATLWSTLPWTS